MKNIVFVAGAGASCDFQGFPVGSGLARIIDTQLTGELAERDGVITDVLERHGGFGGEQRDAMVRIAHGIHSRDSIDQFVDDCSDPMVELVAKLAIANAILAAEKESELRDDPMRSPDTILRSMRDTWLGYICRYANPGNRQNFLRTMEGITFVTFNYDRAIERFLLIWAQAILGVRYDEAAKLVSQIPVLHVFGQVGYLRGLPVQHVNEIAFGQRGPNEIWKAANGIKTFTEELDSQHLKAVRSALDSAERVVFLGTQFHKPNMELLFHKGSPFAVNVYATTFGMRQRTVAKLVQSFVDNGCTYQTGELTGWPFMDMYGDEIFEP